MKKVYNDVTARVFRRWPSLSEEGLYELLARYKADDSFAREKIIENTMGCVAIALSTINWAIDELEDLFQVGVIGLIKAVDRFDLTKGTKFKNYAIGYINGEIRRYRRDKSRTIRVPRALYELNYKILKAREKLELSLHRKVTLKELSEELEVDEEVIADSLNATIQLASLSTLLNPNTEESEIELGDSVMDDTDQYEKIINRMTLNKIFNCLDTQEKEILYKIYVLKQSQKKIGEEMNTNQMDISRRKNKILEKVRKYIE